MPPIKPRSERFVQNALNNEETELSVDAAWWLIQVAIRKRVVSDEDGYFLLSVLALGAAKQPTEPIHEQLLARDPFPRSSRWLKREIKAGRYSDGVLVLTSRRRAIDMAGQIIKKELPHIPKQRREELQYIFDIALGIYKADDDMQKVARDFSERRFDEYQFLREQPANRERTKREERARREGLRRAELALKARTPRPA